VKGWQGGLRRKEFGVAALGSQELRLAVKPSPHEGGQAVSRARDDAQNDRNRLPHRSNPNWAPSAPQRNRQMQFDKRLHHAVRERRMWLSALFLLLVGCLPVSVSHSATSLPYLGPINPVTSEIDIIVRRSAMKSPLMATGTAHSPRRQLAPFALAAHVGCGRWRLRSIELPTMVLEVTCRGDHSPKGAYVVPYVSLGSRLRLA